MWRWLLVGLGVFLILLPDPTLITDVLGAMLVAGSLRSLRRKHPFACAPCRCYGCLLGLGHTQPEPRFARWH